MHFQINPASRFPIYEQLVRQVREAVARGDLKPGDRLPAVRNLSQDLVVNPNTVARAYSELARDGLLFNRPGRGVFVADLKPELKDPVRQEAALRVPGQVSDGSGSSRTSRSSR